MAGEASCKIDSLIYQGLFGLACVFSLSLREINNCRLTIFYLKDQQDADFADSHDKQKPFLQSCKSASKCFLIS